VIGKCSQTVQRVETNRSCPDRARNRTGQGSLQRHRSLQPDTAIERGSCVGISASYRAAALQLNGHGRLVTLEGAEPLAARSERALTELGLDKWASVRLGQFAGTRPEVVAELAPVDYAVSDGHHTESATLDYTERILPPASAESVLVLDRLRVPALVRAAGYRSNCTMVGDWFEETSTRKVEANFRGTVKT
jgi:predicted O-methyltransferase YrrM